MDINTFVNSIQLIEWGIRIYKWSISRYRLRGVSKQAREIALALHNYCWLDLQQSTPGISKIGQIDRPEFRDIVQEWNNADTPILLKGKAGTGKSGIALGLAQAQENGGIPVLFMRATDFSENQDPALIIQQRWGMNMTLGDAFSKLAKERECSLIIDQLDTISKSDLCVNLVSLLKAVAGIPNIRILAVSRSYEAEYDNSISSLGFKTIESRELSQEEAHSYLKHVRHR